MDTAKQTSRKRNAEEAFSKPKPRQPHSVNGHQQSNGDHKGRNSNSLKTRADALLETRKQLPIWPHADEIRQKVHENDVLVLVGETGSGKSTQIPQFLYTENWCRAIPSATGHDASKPAKNDTASSKPKIGGSIAILQPRRVAAISLATRVAAEVGGPLGTSSPISTVGYSVRFDTNVSPNTKIKFLTDGMLLQELLGDPWLKGYSCVIVDEVHERGVNIDLVLGFLRKILVASGHGEADGRCGVPLKVVIMSATADLEGILKFFGEEDGDSKGQTTMNGAQQNDKVEHEEQDEQWGGFSNGDNDEPQAEYQFSQSRSTNSNTTTPTTQNHPITVSTVHISGRQYPVTTSYTPSPITALLDATMEKIIHIHRTSPLPGDILVFLSGQEMIESLESLCTTYAETLHEQQHQRQSQTPTTSNSTTKTKHEEKLPHLQPLPLYASLPTHSQSRIFSPSPPNTRRVILATNIAETSLTVPRITHVIDTGKHKSRVFRPSLSLSTLLTQPITQSMAKQRAGRAGRERPGTCWRMYTKQDYEGLERDTRPEILVADLSAVVLMLKVMGVDDLRGFRMLTKLPEQAVGRALEGLAGLGALDDDGRVTELGGLMAALPVRPDLARTLCEGARWGGKVLAGVVDVVAALSLEEGVFLNIHGNGSRLLRNGGKKSGAEELLLNGEKGKSDRHSGEYGSDSDEEGSNPIETARHQLLHRHSDHLTLLNTIRGYASPSTHDRKEWCRAHAVSYRAMSRIMDVRKQLHKMISSKKYSKLKDTSLSTAAPTDLNDLSDGVLMNAITREAVLRCLVSGLWTNVAVLSALAPQQAGGKGQPQNPNQRAPYTTLLTNQPIHIHPSSVLFTQRNPGSRKDADEEGKRNGAIRTSTMPRTIVFTDLIYTSKAYARNVSAVELAWIAEMGKL